ncbi:MAG TPA: glycosyltransferase [bacterium]|nr:glycosyltransferase [bacterium]
MSNITFVIFTYNEEKRIPYVIRNFIKYGEVFIMDDGSTDRTKEISEEMGAKYFLRPKTGKAYVENQEIFDFVKSKIKTDYIYWGFADNIAPKTLVEKLVEVSSQNKYKLVLIPLYTYLWGNTKNFAIKFFSPLFFHKDYVDFSNNHIHETGKFIGKKNQKLVLPNKEKFALHHFSTYDINKFVVGHLRYAEAEAFGKFESNKKFSVVRTILAMIRYAWICRRSLKNFSQGIIIISSYAFFRLMTYAKLYELENNINLENIENNYSKQKEKILKDF